MSGNWKKANFEKLPEKQVVRLITTPALMAMDSGKPVDVAVSGNQIVITISGYAIDDDGNLVSVEAQPA